MHIVLLKGAGENEDKDMDQLCNSRAISQASIWNVCLISFKYLRLQLKAS